VITTSSMGKVFTFEATVLRTLQRPYKISILSYPAKIGQHELRKEKRIECFIPATLTCGDNEIDGVIVDISVGGLKVNIDDPPADPADLCAQIGNHLLVELPSLDMKEVLKFECEVRSTASDVEELSLGLQFVDDDDRQKIEHYVEDMTVPGSTG
jgi:hypothetical protein